MASLSTRDSGGRAPIVGVVRTTIGVLIGAVAIAAIMSFVSDYFFLLLVFPALMGLGVGAIGSAGALAGKLRRPFVVCLIGLIGGVVCYLGMHYLSFLRFKANFLDENRANIVLETGLGGQELDALVEQYLENLTFAEHMKDAAAAGITITRASGSSSSSPTLRGTGAYILWGVEGAIVIVIAILLPLGASRRPFCDSCNQWHVTRGVLFANDEFGQELLHRLSSANPISAADLLVESRRPPYATVDLKACPSCKETDVHYTVSISVPGKKENVQKKLGTGTMPLADLEAIETAVSKPILTPPDETSS